MTNRIARHFEHLEPRGGYVESEIATEAADDINRWQTAFDTGRELGRVEANMLLFVGGVVAGVIVGWKVF